MGYMSDNAMEREHIHPRQSSHEQCVLTRASLFIICARISTTGVIAGRLEPERSGSKVFWSKFMSTSEWPFWEARKILKCRAGLTVRLQGGDSANLTKSWHGRAATCQVFVKYFADLAEWPFCQELRKDCAGLVVSCNFHCYLSIELRGWDLSLRSVAVGTCGRWHAVRTPGRVATYVSSCGDPSSRLVAVACWEPGRCDA
eukprot:384445-Pleurochrysis_carterae.AAC.4